MKQDTLEGKAKTKNGVKRLCFSIICILLEVIFIITIVTRLNEYAEMINLFSRILSGILVLGLYEMCIRDRHISKNEAIKYYFLYQIMMGKRKK